LVCNEKFRYFTLSRQLLTKELQVVRPCSVRGEGQSFFSGNKGMKNIEIEENRGILNERRC
jgi:hypothetical protein